MKRTTFLALFAVAVSAILAAGGLLASNMAFRYTVLLEAASPPGPTAQTSATGQNVVVVPSKPKGCLGTAKQLMDDIGFAETAEVSRFVTATDTYETYTGRKGTPNPDFKLGSPWHCAFSDPVDPCDFEGDCPGPATACVEQDTWSCSSDARCKNDPPGYTVPATCVGSNPGGNPPVTGTCSNDPTFSCLYNIDCDFGPCAKCVGDLVRNAFFVKMNADVDYTFTGSHDPSIVYLLRTPAQTQSKTGTSFVSIPPHSVPKSASELMNDIGFADTAEVSRFLRANDAFDTYTGRKGTPAPDFDLQLEGCCFVKMNNVREYSPSHY